MIENLNKTNDSRTLEGIESRIEIWKNKIEEIMTTMKNQVN